MQLEAGMNIDQTMLIQVLQNKLAQATIREAQMESVIQSQAGENRLLTEQVAALTPVDEVQAEG